MIRKRSFVLLLNLLISFYLLSCVQDDSSDSSDTSENPQYNSDYSKKKPVSKTKKRKIKVNQTGIIQVWRGMDRTYAQGGKNIYKWNEYMGRFNKRYSIKGDQVFYTSLTEETAFKEVHSAQRIKDTAHTRKNFIFEPRVIEDLDNVLDLTDANVLRHLSRGLDEVLTQDDLIKAKTTLHSDAYDLPQIIGHTTKRNKIKRVEAILTPAAQDMPNGKNLVLFEELP
ncbi:MAG: RES family NAD+ phosphorylase [Bdellovibrionales bacterium]|nr:RES family NAD+ phosphorylase [Bdellovibrionales bacterium]